MISQELILEPHAALATALIGSIATLVILIALCAKKTEPEPPSNTSDNVLYSDRRPSSIVGPVPVAPENKSDWTKDLDTKNIGGARSVKKVKKKPKALAKDTFDGGDDGEYGFESSHQPITKDDSLPPLPPVPDSAVDHKLIRTDSQYDGFGGQSLNEYGFDDEPVPPTPSTANRPNLSTMGAEEADEVNDDIEEQAPAWYAGKIHRDLCVEAVTSAGDGDFLVRESSRGDRIVICINDRGKPVSLVVQVTPTKKYRFAGKERESLHDVIFFLRRRPMKSPDDDNHMIKIGKAAPKESALKQDADRRAALSADELRVESGRIQALARGPTSMHASISDDTAGSVVISAGMELYQSVSVEGMGDSYVDDPFVDDNGEEPLYVDMSDANVPSFDYIAEKEEEHRLEQAGHRRVSNQEFAEIRKAARERVESAAAINRQKIAQKSARLRWRQLPSVSTPSNQNLPPVPLPPRPAHLSAPADDDENFASYEDASAREFGGYEEDEIYGSVPRWFAGRLDRHKCEEIIRNGTEGTYIVRESSTGDKYIICIHHGNQVKNFQVYIRGASEFEFSKRKYVSLDAVMDHCQRHGIMKNGQRIQLLHIADW